MRILIVGGTGLIGKKLVKKLKAENHEIILLTRSIEKNKSLKNESVTLLEWDGKTIDPTKVENIDAVINLAGEGIADKRWSPEYKKMILDSRINTTRASANLIKTLNKKPTVLINASAIGYYGETNDTAYDETSKPGKGFLSDVCVEWENEAFKVKDICRVCTVRIGVVLDKNGGAVKKMLPPFLMFAGGPLGSGKQFVSWIHIDDVVNIIIFALKNNISGPINATAPTPVTMKDFSKSFGKSIHRPSWAPVPAFVLKTILGEMSDLLLSSIRVEPKKLIESGYKFEHNEIDSAFKSIFTNE